jgi:hypothetical protein
MVSLVVIGLVLSGGLYYFRNELNAPFRKSDPGEAAESSNPLPPLSAPAAKTRHSGRSRDRQQPEEAKDAATNLIVQVQVGPRLLPTPADVPVHMAFPEIVQKFGEPDVMATWSYEGKLNRKLIYEDRSASLEINIQNGYVVSTRN